jgi:hypothetical protein
MIIHYFIYISLTMKLTKGSKGTIFNKISKDNFTWHNPGPGILISCPLYLKLKSGRQITLDGDEYTSNNSLLINFSSNFHHNFFV